MQAGELKEIQSSRTQSLVVIVDGFAGACSRRRTVGVVVIVIIIVISSCWWPLLALLDSLVGLGELAEGRERVGAELVEDAGHELGELLDLAGAVYGEGVGSNSCVDCVYRCVSIDGTCARDEC